jgi:hypothetical protein
LGFIHDPTCVKNIVEEEDRFFTSSPSEIESTVNDLYLTAETQRRKCLKINVLSLGALAPQRKKNFCDNPIRVDVFLYYSKDNPKGNIWF